MKSYGKFKARARHGMNLSVANLKVWVVLTLTVLPVVAAVADEVTIPAKQLSGQSPGVSAEYPQFANLTLCAGQGGFMEWAFDVQGGSYYVHFLYCSGQRRPCRMRVNATVLPAEMLDGVTSGFMPSDLVWATYGPFQLEKGRNTVRISAEGLMPHFKSLHISPNKQPPPGTAFPIHKAQSRQVHIRAGIESLRRAVQYLSHKFGDEYPHAGRHLRRIKAISESLSDNENDPEALAGTQRQFDELQHRGLVLDNPLLNCDKLLFVKRYTYQSSHYYTDYIDGCHDFGGNICELSLKDGRLREIVPELSDGIFGRFDLDFNAGRVIFGWKRRVGEGFRIYEVGIDGEGLRQVTFPPADEAERIKKYDNSFLGGTGTRYQHHTDDMHPCYLPDGGICFISTRCERGILCDGPDILTTTTLYRANRDGSDIQVLSQSPVSEASPSVMNDGRILYTRWEYVDKADVVIKCLWAMRPDGTGSVEIFGNDITFPDTMLHGRAVGGTNNLFAVIGAPHMPAGVGTVIRLDINRPIRTRRPMTYITPDLDIRAEYGFFHKRDGQWVRDNVGPLYTDAHPLDEKFFLVSCNPDRPYNDSSAYGIYLLDEFGNRVLIYKDDEISCWQPVPLQRRMRPPTIPPTTSQAGGHATIAMADVYEGLDGVPRGTIKYLRVLETLARPWQARRFWDGDSAYQQHAVVSMNTHLHVKRLHGIVPVEPDGSAHFTVPADKNLFFQALDENFMEVQRMRTFINLRPGERRSCIGCHEQRRWAPPRRQAVALTRPADRLAPQPGETAPRAIYYPNDVQPTLDKHCISCHNAVKRDGDLNLTGELTTLFSRSYEEILKKDLISVWRENDPKTGEAAPLSPYSLGSHKSKLIDLVRKGHEGVKLSRTEFITLVTWVDSNAAFYGSYFGRRNLKYKDHPDFRPVPVVSAAEASTVDAGVHRP